MKETQVIMNPQIYKISLIIAIILTPVAGINGQNIPDEYKTSSIPGQLEELEAHTRIYDNYRAIREDIFQLIKKNINDTLKSADNRINKLVLEAAVLSSRMDSTHQLLESTRQNLDEMTRTKNSIGVIGLKVNKTIYNPIMWSIVGILIFLLVLGYLIFKSNRNTMLNLKKELLDLKKEMEDYRQKKRIEIEKLNMDHFNEVKKLKGDSPKR